MTGSPILCARKVRGPAEVVAVRRSGEPARLACSLARRSAGRLGAVALVAAIARIGAEILSTALALAAASSGHASPPSCKGGASSARAMADQLSMIASSETRTRDGNSIRHTGYVSTFRPLDFDEYEVG